MYGTSPTTKAGKYFRNSIWWWHPLWEYCLKVDPWISEMVLYGHSNDGDGLNGEQSIRLAKVLKEEIESGRTKRYADARRKQLKRLPDEPCTYCDSTGIRSDAIGIKYGYHTKKVEKGPRKGETGWCNGCDGKGSARPFVTNYSFNVQNVKEFATFLEGCGGFEIC